MAATINSGYGNSPKLTANIADHADVHGGRSLVFDGISDYLNCGTTNLDTSDFTVSIWINFNNIGSYERVVGNRLTSGASQGFEIRTAGGSNGYEAVLDYGSAHFSASATYTSTNEWHHVCVTADRDGNMVLYINGLAESTVDISSGSSGSLNHSENLILGARPNFTAFFNGKMCDFKLFKGIAFSESQVQELYKKPESNPSNTTQYLERWYPMIEGNPESPQSTVFDHSEKKLGSELITASLDTGSGITSSSYITYDGKMNINASGQDFYIQISNTADTSSKNFRYRLVVTVDSYTSGSMQMAGGSAGYNSFTVSDSFDDIISPDSNGGSFQFRVVNYVAVISSISLKKIKMGNHATTNFFGDMSDLLSSAQKTALGTMLDSDDNSFIFTNGNTPTGTNKFSAIDGTIEITSNNLKLTNDGTTQAHVALPFTTVLGKSYVAEIKLTTANMSGGLSVSDDLNENTLSVSSSSGAIITSNTFVATGTTSYVHIKNNSTNNNQYNLYDNLKVREVGVSSSGFETAVNEPVVPQVPLMRYNQKMLVPSNESTDTYVLLPDGLTQGLTEFTFSIWHKKNIGDASVLFSVNGGGSYIRFLNATRVYAFLPAQTGGFTVDGTIVDDGNLHHYVLSISASSNESKLYVDGVLIATSTNDGNYYNANIRNIGNYAGVQTPSMHDEFSIFNTALTQAQIQELFNDGVALDATTHSKKGNLLGYWRNDGITTWQDRRGWSFLDFDGSSDEVTLDSELTFTGVFSVSFWVKHNSSGTEYVLGKVGGDQDYFYVHPTHPRWRINDVIASSNTAMAVGVWHHVLGVRDSSNVLKWYLNGSAGTLYNGSSYVTTGVTRSGDFDVQYFGRSLNTYGEIELTNVAFFNTDKSSSASTFYNNGLAYDYTTESGITNYYKMDSSSTLLDRVGSVNGTVDATLNDGNDGTVQGTPKTITIREGLNQNKDALGFNFTNPSSNVLRLNGVDEQIIVPDTDFNFSSQMTFECWAKNNSDNNTVNEFLISQYDYDNNQRAFRAFIHSNGALYCTISNTGSGSNTSQVNTTNAISNLDNWHHYAFTFSSGTFVIYIDGAAATISTGSVVASVTSIHNSTADIQIGSSYPPNATGGEWNGLIDEVKIYNRALSLAEIQKNYKHQKGKHKND